MKGLAELAILQLKLHPREVQTNLNLGFCLLLCIVCCVACTPRSLNSDVASEAPNKGPQSLSIVSFNGKHWGRKSQNIEAAASLLWGANPDLVGLQEVDTGENGVSAVTKLGQILSQKLNAHFCISFSDIPTESRERYAFLWRESTVSYVTTSGEVKQGCLPFAVTLPLFNRHAEQIVREPVYAMFQTNISGKKFIASTVHLVPRGKRPEDEVPSVFESLPQKGENFANVPLILMGDFNLSSEHSAFQAVKSNGFMASLPSGTKTSLKMKKREYNEAYDQFFTRGLKCEEGSRIDVYALLPNMSEKEIYNKVSDHAPIHTTCVL